MFKIKREMYGFKMEFKDFIKAGEMKQWLDESQKALMNAPNEFGVLVDMRELKPLPQDAQKLMETGQKMYKQRGMNRSVVILDNAILTMQFQRIAKDTGIDKWERYIDASKIRNWEFVGINWIKKGIEPN